MKKFFIRIIVFLSITAPCIVIPKWYTNNGDEHEIVYSDKLASPTDTSVFFIGSSRVQRSVDPTMIINNHYRNFHVFNLGISRGSFLSSCIMADFVIRQKGNKVLFIELAPMLDEIPESLFNLSEATGMKPLHRALVITEDRPFSARTLLAMNILNHHLYTSISLYEDVKKVIGYKVTEEQWIGFYSSDINTLQNTSSFLTWDEINSQHSNYSIDLTKYTQAISHLQNLAKCNHSKIIFFLRLMCQKQGEKKIVISLYTSLPDSLKLNLPFHIINEMTKREYMMDQFHLNRQGATIYSKSLIPLIEGYFDK